MLFIGAVRTWASGCRRGWRHDHCDPSGSTIRPDPSFLFGVDRADVPIAISRGCVLTTSSRRRRASRRSSAATRRRWPRPSTSPRRGGEGAAERALRAPRERRARRPTPAGRGDARGDLSRRRLVVVCQPSLVDYPPPARPRHRSNAHASYAGVRVWKVGQTARTSTLQPPLREIGPSGTGARVDWREARGVVSRARRLPTRSEFCVTRDKRMNRALLARLGVPGGAFGAPRAVLGPCGAI